MGDARLFPATPTKLTTWLDCPQRYRLTYVDRTPKGPPWAHNSFGGSVHNALRDWFTLEPALRNPQTAVEALRRNWQSAGYRDDDQSAQWRARAEEMLTRYVSGVDPQLEPVGVERTVALPTTELALSGRADRIDARQTPDGAEELVVVDYKTGRHLLSTADARSSLALAVYALAAQRTLRRPCRRVELHHLPSGEVVVWEHDDASLRRHLQRAHDIARDARDAERTGEFPAQVGPLCGYCDVLRSCEEGLAHTGGIVPAPWSVLDAWESDADDLDPDEGGARIG